MPHFPNSKLPHFCSVKINYILLRIWGCFEGNVSVKSCINTWQTYSSSHWKDWGLCKKEQLQLLRKQSMPMCHNSTSTSTFFKNINLKLKWKTSHFRSVPKTLERQHFNQNIALPFVFHFLLLSSSGHLLMLTQLIFTSLSTSDHFSCLLILRKVRALIYKLKHIGLFFNTGKLC